MNNEDWLELFKEIGRELHGKLSEIMTGQDGTIALGRGAGGDKTFPVDRWAEDIILGALEKAHRAGEAFTLISEELGIRDFGNGNKIVLVDPVDGSNNAKNGIPFFSTALALLDGNTLSDTAVAYVVNPCAGDTFWAVRGKGAYKNGLRLTTSPAETLAIVACEASTPAVDIPRIMPVLTKARRMRCFGSTALDLAYLASGAVSVFLTATASRTFDYAAGRLIVQEAGGVVTDLAGGAIDDVTVGLARTVPLLASANATLHEAVLKLLANG